MIKIGIIGTSKISGQFADAVSKIEDCCIEVVCSRSVIKAEEFASKYGIEKVVTSLEELEKIESVDMIYIASPNSLHCEQAIKFLKAKKHVLCEKPMGVTPKEIEDMFNASKENGVCLMEAMKGTHLPNYKSIKENLHKVGQIRGFIGNFCQYSSRYTDLKNGILTNIFDPKFGGGAHLDIGVYPLYFAISLFGMPKNSLKLSHLLSSGVPGIGSIALEYSDMIATIFYSKITNSYIGSEIQGELGSIVIDSISNINNVKICYNNGEIEDITIKQDENNMIYEIKEFIKMIEHNQLESLVNNYHVSQGVISILTK